MQKKIMISQCENVESRKIKNTEVEIGIDQGYEGSLIAEYVKIWYTCTK